VRPSKPSTVALLTTAVLAAMPLTSTAAEAAVVYGPAAPYTTILKGQFTFVSLPDSALIDKTDYGYVYKAGKQDSHLVVTRVDGGLRFHDTGTHKFKSLPGSCTRDSVAEGVAAVCAVPDTVSSGSPMLLEIWPRLGDDFVDASSLSADFDVTVLGDAGADVISTGAGNDFVNGAFDDDLVSTGAGNDWARTGDGEDTLQGEDGADKLVGSAGHDVMSGGAGDDIVYGGVGADELRAGTGRDLASCGDGPDLAYVDSSDRTSSCESVSAG
jgi:serralysin